jgi:hypothetical protein
MYARMAFDSAAKVGAHRVFGGIEPTHQQQMRFRFALQNGVERLHQLGQPLVAGQPAYKTQNKGFRGKAEPLPHGTGTRRESFHIDPIAASIPNEL